MKADPGLPGCQPVPRALRMASAMCADETEAEGLRSQLCGLETLVFTTNVCLGSLICSTENVI
jgi:hypothetical protein